MPPSQHPSRICLPDGTWLIDTGQNRERAKKVRILENERFNENENETEVKAENEHVVGAEGETQDEDETETKVENDGGDIKETRCSHSVKAVMASRPECDFTG